MERRIVTLPEQAPRPPAQVAPEGDDRRTAATDLLIISFSLLFLEQACIRWLASNLRLLQCTANFTLLACFLGMGLGMLRARSRSLLGLTLPLLLIGCLAMSSLDLGIVLNSVGLGSSQVVASRSTLFAPLWVILSVIFVFVAVLFVGPGQAIGNLFGRLAPLEAYSWNVGGSILGILVFMGFSAFSLAPAWWFVVGGCCVLWLLRNSRIPLMISAVSLIAAVVLIARLESDAIWSPYNRITLAERTVQGNRILGLFVNRISFQVLLPLNSPGGHFYDFPYLFNRMGRGRSEPGRFLVIGAGTGNDVSHILAAGASHVDAVEIDPAILKIGRERHPERPYADPRVKAWVDDGRGFLRRSTDKYDFIVYALVDSMSILSQFGTVRLENYLFTEDAIRDVKNHLAPDGIFAMYNYYGHGWLVARIYRVMQKVFGEENVVMMSFPPRAVYDEDTTDTAFVAFFAGDVKKIRALLDGGQMQIKVSAWERDGKDELVPLVATREVRGAPALIPTDDWPFIYLRQHAIPEETWLSVGVIAGVSVIMLFGLGGVRPRHIRPHFFFLGAAFMLIET
ncbi:MAG: hypothetical protein FJX76_27405, partial [Armatimonadetes bacterium]|nr:hypothetical protein [Armatimonadota bacterium]